MKVLQVWDQGIGGLLAEYVDSMFGSKTVGITLAEFDSYGYTPAAWKRSYPAKVSTALYESNVIRMALGCNVVHVHSLDTVVPMLKRLGKPVVLHYHGSDIRGKWATQERYWRCADRILVSTRDLLSDAPLNTSYQPNPVDTRTFKPEMPLGGISPLALYFDYGAVDIADAITERHGLHLHVEEKGVPYADMPRTLNRYSYCVDVKRDYAGRLLITEPDDTLSLIGLQALACGLTVLTLAGDRRGLPEEHTPERVAASVYQVYREVVEQ